MCPPGCWWPARRTCCWFWRKGRQQTSRQEKGEQNPKSEIRPSSVAVLRRVENPKSREAGRSSNAEARSLRPKAAKQEMGDRRREKGMEIPNPKIQIPNKSPTSNFKSAPQSEVWRNVALTLTNRSEEHT